MSNSFLLLIIDSVLAYACIVISHCIALVLCISSQSSCSNVFECLNIILSMGTYIYLLVCVSKLCTKFIPWLSQNPAANAALPSCSVK